MGEKEISTGERMIQRNAPYRIEMKLLSPLAGVFFRKCRHGKKGGVEEPGREMDGRELADYEEAIRKAVDKVNRPEIEGGNPFDLMEECFDGSPSIQEKVEHGAISVENVEGVLYGCTTLLLKEDWRHGNWRKCANIFPYSTVMAGGKYLNRGISRQKVES